MKFLHNYHCRIIGIFSERTYKSDLLPFGVEIVHRSGIIFNGDTVEIIRPDSINAPAFRLFDSDAEFAIFAVAVGDNSGLGSEPA